MLNEKYAEFRMHFSKGKFGLRQVILFVIFTMLFFAAEITVYADEDIKQKKVLLIHAEDQFLPANIVMDKEISSVLKSADTLTVSIFSEFLEKVRFNSDKTQNEIIKLLQEKYTNFNLDLVMVTDDTSWDFITENGDTLFPGVPVVFCGITEGKIDTKNLQDHITGNFKDVDIKGTIEDILQVQPDTKEIAVVIGTSKQDAFYEARARDAFKKYLGKIKVNYIIGFSVEETQKKISKLSPNTVVLYVSMYIDGVGKGFNPRDVLPLLRKATNVPIYGVSDTYLGYGIVGGRLVSFSDISRNAAGIALQVLNGKKPSEIPAVVSQNRDYFDGNEMKQWGINESNLPEGSIIVNKVSGLWDLYKAQIMGAIVFLLIETVLIFILFLQLNLKKKAEGKLLQLNAELEEVNARLEEEIAERIKTEDALKESERQFRHAVEEAPIPIMLHAEDGEVIKISSAWTEVTGYTHNDIPTTFQWAEKAYGIMNEEFHTDISRLFELDQRQYDGEYSIIIKDGHIHIWDFYSSYVGLLQDGRKMIMSVALDVTDRKKREEEILYISYHDVLTGLYNRRYFEEEVKKYYSEDQYPVSIIIGDINGLKLTNDIFGHLEGDQLLIRAAVIMKKFCRSVDIVARWGGDEFIILLPRTTEKRAEEICRNIDNDCHGSGEQPLKLSISVGYAAQGNPEEDIMKVLKRAEDFMYQHKLLESRSLRSSVVASIKRTLYEKSHETEEHAERIKQLSREAGVVMGISEMMLYEMELLSVLHDIGKIAIKDHVLNKPSELNEDEWREMKRHPEIGYHIAKSTPELSQVADYILSHHERWDGSGYPRGLAGENIPILSRILAVIDAYDAMTNDRPYRTAISSVAAVQELLKNAGTQFDPEIVHAFVDKVLGKSEDEFKAESV